jgi:hypothetical protein
MKSLAFLLFALALAVPLHAQEILKNSDFSDGATYWHGDAKPAGTEDSTDLISDPASSAKGIVVELHSGGWTKVVQEIRGYKSNGRASQLMLTIVYQTSPDFKLSTHDSDYVHIGAELGFEGASLTVQQGQLIAFIDEVPQNRVSASSSGGYTNYTVYSDPISGASFLPSTEAKQHTFTSPISVPHANPDSYPSFCLGLPPGSGTITILKISVAPASSDSGAAQAP